jgi:hypothetical protein
MTTRTAQAESAPEFDEVREPGIDRGWQKFGFLAIAAFVAVAATDETWRSNPVFHDHWIYYGFQRNLHAHLRDFAWTYWSTRLAILIPGALVQRMFGLEWGEPILHTGLLVVSLVAVRACGRRMFGDRAGALAVVLAGTNYFFLLGMASDYTDGYGICYLLLTTLALLRALSTEQGRNLSAVCAGFFAACVVLTNIAFAVCLPILVIMVLVGLPWTRQTAGTIVKRLIVVAILGTIGMAATLAAAEIWFHAQTGVHIWQPNLHFIREFSKDETFAIQDQRNRLTQWMPEAAWLIWPMIVTAAGLISLVGMARGRSRGPSGASRRMAFLSLIQAGLLAGTVAELSLKLDMFGRLWFYGVVLYLPVTIFLAAGLLDRFLPVTEDLSLSRYLPAGALLSAGLLAVHGAGVLPGFQPGIEKSIFVSICIAGLAGFWLTSAGASRRAPGLMLTGLAILGATQGPVRAMFRIDAGRTQALVEFAMLDRCRILDINSRTHAAAAVQDVVERCLALAPANDLGFWYDKDAQMAPVFEMVNASFAYGRILSKDMSDLRAKPLGGMQVGLEPGRVVVVMSEDPDFAKKAAQKEFERLGVQARELGVRELNHGPVKFAFHAWEVTAAPEDLAGEHGRVRVGHKPEITGNGVRR